MPTWYRQAMASQGPVNTPLEPLAALRPMRRDPYVQVMRGQDHVPAQSRRIIARADVSSVERDITTKWELTPGCFPMISVMSTATSVVGSAVTGTVTFHARTGADDAQQVSVPLNVGVVGTDDGAGWFATSGPVKQHVIPSGTNDTSELERFCECITVDISLAYPANVVDLVVYEMPYHVAVTEASQDDRRTSHVITQGTLATAAPQLPFPVDELNDSDDPRGGTLLLAEVANAQALRLGPGLLYWRGDTANAPSGSMACVYNSSLTAYDADNEGLSVASGGHGRRWADNSPHVIDSNGSVIPMRVWCNVTTTGTGFVRVQTSPDSWVDVPITSTGETSGFGYLEVGANADEHVVAQIFQQRDTGSTFRVESVCVQYGCATEAPSDP